MSALPQFTRRTLLSAAAAIGAGGVAAACGNDSTPADDGAATPPPGPTGGSSGGSSSPGSATTAGPAASGSSTAAGAGALPAYTPYNGAKPDLPGTPEGVMDGFLTFPANPQKAVSGTPAQGITASALIASGSPVPPPLDKNQYWQQLNKRLGATLKLSWVTGADYPRKFATTVAGGDLPDFLSILGSQPDLPELLQSKCQDLTPFLSGDAVNDYPLLANLPTASWKACVFNGRIYGVPFAAGRPGYSLLRRDDIIAAKGLDPDPADFASFRQLCQDLTDVRASSWATAQAPVEFVAQMLKVPNNWKLDNGKLVRFSEVEQMKQALAATKQLLDDGVVHPDSLAANAGNSQPQWFQAGSAALLYGSYGYWIASYSSRADFSKPYTVGGMQVPGYDGGPGAPWKGAAANRFTVLKKGSDERVKQLLAICNYVAAPFGTEEFEFLKYGIKGIHYTMENGAPSVTKLGVTEAHNTQIGYISGHPPYLYMPHYQGFDGEKQVTQAQYDFQVKKIPESVDDPTYGYFSPTQASKGASIDKAVHDRQTDILLGRKPLSSWDDAVKAWRSAGGDSIRHEYEQALAGG